MNELERPDSSTRRSVLRKGIAAGGIILSGTAAASGTVSANGGGTGFISAKTFRRNLPEDTIVKFVAESDCTVERSPGCSNNPNAPTRDLPTFIIQQYDPASDTLEGRPYLFAALSRNHEVGDVKELVKGRQCGAGTVRCPDEPPRKRDEAKITFEAL